MNVDEAGTEDMPVEADESLTQADAVRLAEAYVGAYNDRDLAAMPALQGEGVVSRPAQLFGRRPHTGHAGVVGHTVAGGTKWS